MTRHHMRLLSIAALFAVSGLFVYLGFRKWVIFGILPLQNLGYLLAGAAVLGLLGVNIWYGGPLDPHGDRIIPPNMSLIDVDPIVRARWEKAQSTVKAWGARWDPVPPGSGLQQELDRELTPDHPLTKVAPIVFGRCQSCDDIVAAIANEETSFAVIHLTWRGRPEQQGWPSFDILKEDQFISRFLHQGEHS